MPLEVSITNEEKVLIAVAPVTAHGHPAPIDGPISATVQSGSGSAVVQPDGKSFFAVSGDDPGDTAILVEADADLGSGVETISDVVIVHVQGAKAAALGLSAGAPEQK